MSGLKVPGRRVQIQQLEHSPAATREYGSQLIGRRGEILSLLMKGRTALVRLEEAGPRGVRRWSVSCDDLIVIADRDPRTPVREDAPLTGITGRGRRMVLHAVCPGGTRSLCGRFVRLLSFAGPVPFSGSARRACLRCIDETAP